MPNFKCKHCSNEYDNYNSLRKHMSRIHKVNSETFYREFYLNGKEPEKQLCKCGCGNATGYRGLGIWSDYCKGHIARVHNNWGHNKSAQKKSIETRRERFVTGEISTWNKGLTVDDPRVAENIRKINTPERAAKISAALTGVAKTSEHAAKSKVVLKEYWSKPENKKKQSITRLEWMRNNIIPKTSKLEAKFEELLQTLNIEYIHQFYTHDIASIFDFKIKNKNILIEVDGDWWHCNPNLGIIAEYDSQKKNLIGDAIKNKWAAENGYKLLRFWENDINNNIQQVVRTLLNEIA